jgi:hypothetical protein
LPLSLMSAVVAGWLCGCNDVQALQCILSAVLAGSWSLVKETGVDQMMLSYHKTQQHTARIARTDHNVVVCR